GPEALHGSSSPSERLPIIEHVPVRFGADDRARIERHAARLRLQEPGLAATAAFGRGVRPGVGAGPWLHIHDTSSLRITGRSHASPLEYRAFALAGAGDIVALHVPRDTAFEAYCRDVLGFGELEVLRAATAGPNASLAMRCVRDPWVLDRLVARAEEAGGLTVHPYLGSGGVWALAGRIAARSGDPVLVAAPPPRLARRVNNKIWFTQRAEELLGPRSVPSSRETYSLAILAGAVRDLARDHDRIGIKLPIAAGGAGNVVIDTASLRELPLTVIRDRLARLLARAAWGDPFPLLVSVWESPVVLSPSVQLWIPHAVDGPPIVEGIFEQRSSGLIGRFIGAVPAEL